MEDKKRHGWFGKKNPHHKNNRHFNGKKLRVIPLGGLEEVGKNIAALEYRDGDRSDIIIIDAGLSFAGPEMLGVDFIVPDISYLEARKRDVRGILLTHGHLDHIGAIQYVMPRLGNPPVYGSKLTLGMTRDRLKEYALDKSAKLHEVDETTKVKLGPFHIEFFPVNHSIPGSMGIYVETPVGKVVHTGDFKFDHSPAIDKPADFQRIAKIGSKDIDVLMIDSTNALKPGFCQSEADVANTLEGIIKNTKGRLIIACFASLIGRICQLIEYATKNGRTVFVSGRSMVNNIKLAEKLHYATYPKGTVRKISPQVNSMPPNKVMILTTGAQGEDLSALTRMSLGEHSQVQLREGDTVVISASPIPGNELAVVAMRNNLTSQKVKVITNDFMNVHVTGHAHQEELKLMRALINPKCYLPIHGEQYMRAFHADYMEKIGPPGMIATYLNNNGDILEVNKQGIRRSKEKVSTGDILVDGLGLGNIGSRVIQDRKVMSEDGVVVMLFHAYEQSKRLVGEPNILSRGFLYLKESEEVANEVKQVAKKAFENITHQNRNIELKDLKEELARNISNFIRKRLRREPMIIPIITYT